MLIPKSFSGYGVGLPKWRHHRTLQPRKSRGVICPVIVITLPLETALPLHLDAAFGGLWEKKELPCMHAQNTCALVKGIQHSHSIRISQKQTLVPSKIWEWLLHYFHCRSFWMTKQIICLGDLLLQVLPLYCCNCWGRLAVWYKTNEHLGSKQLANVSFKLDREYTIVYNIVKNWAYLGARFDSISYQHLHKLLCMQQ